MDKKGLRRCGEKWRVSSLDRKCLKGPEAKHQFIRAIYTNQRHQKRLKNGYVWDTLFSSAVIADTRYCKQDRSMLGVINDFVAYRVGAERVNKTRFA